MHVDLCFDGFAREHSSGSVAGLNGQWYHDGKPTRILVAPR